MYYIFIEDEKINGAGQARILNEEITNFEVTEDVYNAFVVNPDKYIWDTEKQKIIENPKYEEEQIQARTIEFYNNFVVTSWGAFRKTPKGYSSAVEAVNTIFNMVNVAQSLTEELANLLIFYEVPDFKQAEQCTEKWLVAHQKTHEACDLQTFMTWYLEFQTVWAKTQYTDIPITQMEI